MADIAAAAAAAAAFVILCFSRSAVGRKSEATVKL